MSRRPGRSPAAEAHAADDAHDNNDDHDDTTAGKPSKTRRKAQARALQDLGADLARLSAEQLARIDMPEPLREALDELRRTRSHEGRRRQTQLVGKLMRQLDDAQPLREALAAIELGGARDALALHRAEYWRDALVADDANLARFATEHPCIDVQELRALVRRARAEKVEPSTPGTAARHGKAWRELFRFIRPSIRSTP
jgi:ribosome-associated protein